MRNTNSAPAVSRWNIYKELIRLGLPVLVTELGVIVVSFADTIMVARAGTNELAAAAFVNNLFLVPVVMLIGFASGITPIAGALFSSGKHVDMGRVLRVGAIQNSLMAVLFSIVMGVLYFFIPDMGLAPELVPLVQNYYLIILTGLIPAAIFNCCQQVSNGARNTAMPMWIILGANLLNILGNYILIFGHWGMPRLGLDGAGISTVVSRGLAAVVILVVMFRFRRFSSVRPGYRMKGGHALRRKVFVTSVPTMLQSGVECMLWAFGSVVCGWFLPVDLAAYQVTTTMSQIGFMTYLSFGIALSIIVANRIGVNDLPGVRRATNAGVVINIMLATIACSIFFFGGKDLLRIFTEDEAVIALAHTLLPPLILYQFFDALQIVYANAIRGTSRVNPLLWASAISYIIVGMPAAYFLGYTMSLKSLGVYYSFAIAIFTVFMCLFLWYRAIIADIAKKFDKNLQ